jgi:hypothetical protein
MRIHRGLPILLTTVGCSFTGRHSESDIPHTLPVYEAVLAFADSTAAGHLGTDLLGPSPRLALSARVVPFERESGSTDSAVGMHHRAWLESLPGRHQVAAVCESAKRLWECGVQYQRMAAAISELKWETPSRVSAYLYLSHPEKDGMRGAFAVTYQLWLERTDNTWRVVRHRMIRIT